MKDDQGNWHPYEPLGSNLTPQQARSVPISDERRRTHALEHIAQVLDRIDAKLDAALRRLPPEPKP